MFYFFAFYLILYFDWVAFDNLWINEYDDDDDDDEISRVIGMQVDCDLSKWAKSP